MAKRQTKGSAVSASESTVHPLFPAAGWDPVGGDDRRDQSYLRKVKPQSPNQKRLMEAIKDHNLVVALGPAGTGKTYLAISSAVEALEEDRKSVV